MNIQFIRLDWDVCEPVNQLAVQNKRTVSDLVNDAVREYLRKLEQSDHDASGNVTPKPI